jgi:carboxylesterase type B
VVDGTYVPASPVTLLNTKQYDSSIQILDGHNSNEGILFTSPFITTSSAYNLFLKDLLPNASEDTITYISTTLYPPPTTDGTQGYTSQTGRVSSTYADLAIKCNAQYLHTAFPNQLYSYLFAIAPGWHSNDLHYTFYDTPSTNPDFNVTVAETLQRYIVSFAKGGNPNAVDVPDWPLWSEGGGVQRLGREDIGAVDDDVWTMRCAGWLEVLGGYSST